MGDREQFRVGARVRYLFNRDLNEGTVVRPAGTGSPGWSPGWYVEWDALPGRPLMAFETNMELLSDADLGKEGTDG